MPGIHYSRTERFILIALAVAGLVGINGAFLYGAIFHEEAMAQVFANPIALAFMIEAMLLMFVLAWLLNKWGVSTITPGWFVLLCLIGSVAFALPLALLLSPRNQGHPEPSRT